MCSMEWGHRTYSARARTLPPATSSRYTMRLRRSDSRAATGSTRGSIASSPPSWVQDHGWSSPLVEGQFNSVAFELDGDAHFAAGIPTGDVLATASNATSRITGPYRSDRRTCCLGQPEPCTPAKKVRLVEHLPSAAGTAETPLATFGCANCARSLAPTCTFGRLQP